MLVDGGANRWFQFITKNGLLDSIEEPHFVTGDMDSISEVSKQRLETMNCQRFETPDQDETDATKSLIVLRPYLASKNVSISVWISIFIPNKK